MNKGRAEAITFSQIVFRVVMVCSFEKRDVSGKHTASIINVEESAKQATNRRKWEVEVIFTSETSHEL
jgi:hypothetical protein